MSDFKRSVEKAIGDFKYGDDRWVDVFERLDAEGGIDNKKLVAVIICILEELDERKKD